MCFSRNESRIGIRQRGDTDAILRKLDAMHREVTELKKRIGILEDIGLNHTKWFMDLSELLKSIDFDESKR